VKNEGCKGTISIKESKELVLCSLLPTLESCSLFLLKAAFAVDNT